MSRIFDHLQEGYSAPCGSVMGIQSADPRSSKELRRQHIDVDGHSFRLCDEGPGDATYHFTPDIAISVLEQHPEAVCVGCRIILVRNYSAAMHLGTAATINLPIPGNTSTPINPVDAANMLDATVDMLTDLVQDHPRKRALMEHLREIKLRTQMVRKELQS